MTTSPLDDPCEQQRVPRQCGYLGCPDDACECRRCGVMGCVALVFTECQCDDGPDLWLLLGPVGSPPVRSAEVSP